MLEIFAPTPLLCQPQLTQIIINQQANQQASQQANQQNQANNQDKNTNSKYININTKSTNAINQTTDIDELLRNIDRIISMEFSNVNNQQQNQDVVNNTFVANTSLYADNKILYTSMNPTTNITNTNMNSMTTHSTQNNSYSTQSNMADDEIEQDIISFVDKLRFQSSKITITEKNHIKTEIELTNNELLILKLAVLHNNNIVNLMSQTDDIKNLMNKGLLHISENGCSLIVDKIVEVIIKTNTHKGNMVVAEYDEVNKSANKSKNKINNNQDNQGNQGNQGNKKTNKKKSSQECTKHNSKHINEEHINEEHSNDKYNNNEELFDNEELSFDDYNKNVQSFEWSIDSCADKQVSLE